MATHSRMLAWRIPWSEKPGGLQSIGPQTVGHDWSNLAHTRVLFTKLPFPEFFCPPKVSPLIIYGTFFPRLPLPNFTKPFPWRPLWFHICPLPSTIWKAPCVPQMVTGAFPMSDFKHLDLSNTCIPRLWAKDLHAWPGLPDGKWQRTTGMLHGFPPHHPNSTRAFFTQDWQPHRMHYRA